MTFERLKNEEPCDCLKDTFQDSINLFARVLNKETVADKDFLSKWDKGNTSEDCEELCGLKGVSISKIENDGVKEEIITLYSQVFKLSPKYKRGVLLFKFKVDAGVLKFTPDDTNKYHHDFYKADGFTLSSIEHTGIEYLKAVAGV